MTHTAVDDALENLQIGCMLVIVALAPWAFGCVHPLFEMWLCVGLLGLLTICSARWIWNPLVLTTALRRTWPAGLALALLLGCVAVPLMPMPHKLAAGLSPAIDHWQALTQPTSRETLASRTAAIPAADTWLLSGGLTLHRAGNWQMLWRLSALWLVFLASASLSQPRRGLRLLAWGAVGVGSLLALVALLQSLTPGNSQIYWYFETKGTSYGPFLNRNHYPFFANLAIGLSLGLLVERRAAREFSWLSLANDTTSLWLIAALAIQICSLAMGLSRGGIVSLLVALTVCLAVGRPGPGRGRLAAAGVLIAAGVVGLMSWTGFDLLQSRLASLGDSDTFREDGRWYLWRVAAIVGSWFPVLGAGGETFRHWETIIQFGGVWNSQNQFAHRADNEYLDVFCEHGAVAAISLLAFVGLLLGRCLPRVRVDGLMLGVGIGLVSVALHSCVDFGLRLPATAVFATFIAGLGYAACRETSGSHSRTTASIRASILALGVTASVLAFFGGLLREKQRFAISDSEMTAAYHAAANEDWPQARRALELAIAATPDDVLAHIEVARVAQIAARRLQPPAASDWLNWALEHCVQARDICPLAWEPHFWLAEHVNRLSHGSSRLAYLERAHRLHPSQPTIAFWLGQELYRAGAEPAAIDPVWAAAVARSSQYLPSILENYVSPESTAQEALHVAGHLRDTVLPDDPQRWVDAAEVFAQLGHRPAEQLLLASAVELMEGQLPQLPPERQAAALGLVGDIHVQLDQLQPAVEAFRSAVRRDPSDPRWRVRLIQTLIAAGDAAAAASQLRLLEVLQPEMSEIPTLLRQIEALDATAS